MSGLEKNEDVTEEVRSSSGDVYSAPIALGFEGNLLKFMTALKTLLITLISHIGSHIYAHLNPCKTFLLKIDIGRLLLPPTPPAKKKMCILLLFFFIFTLRYDNIASLFLVSVKIHRVFKFESMN